jgi:hypothetical protein
VEQRLSEWLNYQAEFFFDMRDGNRLSAADQEARFYLERIAEELIEGREAFTDGCFEVLERALRKEPEITEGEIDRVLTRRSLSGMRGMVRRLVDLSKLDRVRIPSAQTAEYVREAAQSYVFGLYQCSAAMGRAALEQALKEVLERQGVEDFVSFKELRREAEEKKILDAVTGPAARKIARDASGVIHNQPANARLAFDILSGSRGLIVQIYAAAEDQSSRPHAP